jgi:lysophospholipase L1-like esterase
MYPNIVTAKTDPVTGGITLQAGGRNISQGPLKSAIRNIAKACRVMSESSAPNNQCSSAFTVNIPRNASQAVFIFPTWYVSQASGLESDMGGTVTLTASVENPVGTFRRLTFSGASSVTVAAGSNINSDPIDLSAGANRVWTWRNCSAGMTYITSLSTPTGDGSTFGATTPDQTAAGGSVVNGTIHYGPIAVVAETTYPSVIILGDSITQGAQDGKTAAVDSGSVARSVGQQLTYSNMGAASTFASQTVSAPKRLFLSQYFTHCVISYGANDIGFGATSAQLIGYINQIITQFAALKCYVCTVTPYTTSSDSWATVVNQTVKATEAARVTYNNALRAGEIPAAHAIFDVADAVESSRDSGKWSAPGFTVDGLHPVLKGYLAVQLSGRINPAFLS